jgi:hypothetical protein
MIYLFNARSYQAFLQCNQYVVAPTAGQYADMLGLTPSMNGNILSVPRLRVFVEINSYLFAFIKESSLVLHPSRH